MSASDPWTLSWGGLSCLPVCHYRLEFAEWVHAQLEKDTPDCIAIELPSHLTEAYVRAVSRLPAVSILLYEDASGNTVYLPVEPVDPFTEAARFALERGIPVHLVDINLEEAYPPFHDPVPDPYALHKIGPRVYYESFRTIWKQKTQDHTLDVRREQGMAARLQKLLRQHRKVLFVCGMMHAHGVIERLDRPQATPLHPVHSPPFQVFHLHPSCLDEVMATFPILSALYEVRRQGLPAEPQRDRFTLRRSFHIQSRPFALLGKEGPVFDERAALEASLAWIARRAGFVSDELDPPGPIDRNRALLFLLEEAGRHYHEETGEGIQGWQKRTLWKFVRNYALLQGLLLPEFYHLLVGARSCVDDNFCYSLWRLGGFYPWQSDSSDVPTVSVRGEEVWLGTRRLHVRRWLPRKKQRLHRVLRKHRKREKYPGEWLESFDGTALCSYPPEDLVVEDYGRFLREHWKHILTDEQGQSEPFTTSLLDGIDIRETIRKWPEKRIYVKNRGASRGGAGAVVVIFDEDEKDRQYPYRMTWLGEHEQESDMAFYATPPEENVVGPGICRCEYGGFLMIYPPRRLFDVWRDPDYRFLSSKSEVLLAAALDYSLERQVIYVASRPPRSTMRTLAERLRRQIVYIPRGALSPSRLKKIRIFHILSGYDKRDTAKEYVI
jgi:hypothetical protein